MNTRLAVLAWFVTASAMFAAPVLGQTPDPRPVAAATMLRTSWNTPDLQGRWTSATNTPLERPAELAGKEFFGGSEAADYEKHALERFIELTGRKQEAAISGEFVETWLEHRPLVSTGRTSLVIGPDGRIPYNAETKKKADAFAAGMRPPAEAPEQRTLTERCLLFGVGGPPLLPGVAYNSNYEFVQTPGYLMIFAEMGSAARIIPLDGRPHVSSTIRSWQGDSRGRWDGDTLVVETTNFNEQRDFNGSHGNLHLVERFKRVSADLIMYQFTATDETAWTKPWSGELPLRSFNEPLFEFACHEGNYSLANILKGARFEEQQRK